MTVLPKDPAVLDCQAHGQPPVTIKWLKNGVRLAESEHIQFLPNGSLYLPKIKHTKEDSDEGIYQCLSQNKYGAILSQRSRLTIASKCGALSKFSGTNMDYIPIFHQDQTEDCSNLLVVSTLWCQHAGTRMASSWVINLEMGSRCTPPLSFCFIKEKPLKSGFPCHWKLFRLGHS